jgi:hypothetical protein
MNEQMSSEERGKAYKLLVPLTSDEARIGAHVRVDDPTKYKVGDTFYLASYQDDEDGFWWVTFVDNKELLTRNSWSSREPGFVTFTAVRLRDIFKLFKPL